MDSPEGAVLIFVDGPASDLRVEMSIPPTRTRWFIEGREMGSDETITWWSMEEPPEDPSVTVTRYDLIEDVSRPIDEDGNEVFTYAQAESGINSMEDAVAAMAGDPEVRRRLEALNARMAKEDEVPRSYFRVEDIVAVMLGGKWVDVTAGSIGMREVLLEPSADSPKLALGPSVIFKNDMGNWVSIPPNAVEAFELSNSSSAIVPEGTEDDREIRVNRGTFEADKGAEYIRNAEKVNVIEDDGTMTVVKDREAVDAE